jgi:hypothetical protein
MCNLYSIVRPRDEMARAFRVLIDRTANQPPLPAVFPDQLAPIVRINSAGERIWSPCAGASRRRPTLPAAPSPMCGIPPAPTGAPGSSRAFAAAGTHANQVLELDCGTPKYRRDRAYHVGALADDFPDHTVGWVLARLVCQECGKRPVKAALARRVGVARPKAVRIWLAGNGAYW